MIVSADTDRLYNAAEGMVQIAAEIKKLNYLIEQLVFSTCDDWQGASERAFAENIITVNEKFDELYTYVNEYSELLKRFANDYENMDAEIAKKIKRI